MSGVTTLEKKFKGKSEADRARILLLSLVGAMGMNTKETDPKHFMLMGLYAGVALGSLDAALMNDLLRKVLGDEQVDELYTNAAQTRRVIQAGMNPPED